MNKAWSGPVIAGCIVVGVVVILGLNFQPGRDSQSKLIPRVAADPAVVSPTSTGANQREYPIGDPVVRNHVQVAAVWLAGVTMDGMNPGPSGSDEIIHLEADIRATQENPNGFAKDEFVPYLKVSYSLVDAKSGASIDSGSMEAMVASDGLHYGASVAMPKPGLYKLIYQIKPPSAGGLGRHVGLGGVAPWWAPFSAEFEWSVEPTTSPTLAGSR